MMPIDIEGPLTGGRRKPQDRKLVARFILIMGNTRAADPPPPQKKVL